MSHPHPSPGPSCHPSFDFTHAITRLPGQSAVNGLTMQHGGKPDVAQMQADHAEYCQALQTAGVELTTLSALENYPDAHFVEDTAFCLPEGAILMRPGAPSRQGEVEHMQASLAPFYPDLKQIKGDSHIEGGDILVTAKEILVGLSARTNQAGIDALKSIVREWGYKLRQLVIPPNVLHFKSDCALLDEETILSTPRLSASGIFKDYRIIHTAEGEEAAANCIRVNQYLIVPKHYPKTADRLVKAGYSLLWVNNRECEKIDGGMSCLSLRFKKLNA